MEIIGWIIIAHGVLWIVSTFNLIYPPAFLVYFCFSYLAGLYMPVAFALNFSLGFIQVALGLYLVFRRWKSIILWSTGAVFFIIAVVLVILYHIKNDIFLLPVGR
jgi:hypothetical protein